VIDTSDAELALQAWGEWIDQKVSKDELGYPSQSSTYSVMTSAPPVETRARVWYCTICDERHEKKPRRCVRCGEKKTVSKWEKVCHGAEKRKTKRKSEQYLKDSPLCEAIDGLLAMLPSEMMDIVRLRYQRGYTGPLIAQVTRTPRSTIDIVLRDTRHLVLGMMHEQKKSLRWGGKRG